MCRRDFKREEFPLNSRSFHPPDPFASNSRDHASLMIPQYITFLFVNSTLIEFLGPGWLLFLFQSNIQKAKSSFLFSTVKLREKCGNRNSKILRRKCVNHANVVNDFLQNSIFDDELWYLYVFISEFSNDWTWLGKNWQGCL